MELGFKVEVCFAHPDRTFITEVEVGPGTTVREAIEYSGLLKHRPDLELARCGFGSYGRRLSLDSALKPGDRLEVYRPLENDPKEMRRRAARRAPGRG